MTLLTHIIFTTVKVYLIIWLIVMVSFAISGDFGIIEYYAYNYNIHRAFTLLGVILGIVSYSIDRKYKH